LQPKAKTIPEFKNAVHLISSAFPEKAVNSVTKDFGKRLQARVSANDGNFEQKNEIIHMTDTDSYI